MIALTLDYSGNHFGWAVMDDAGPEPYITSGVENVDAPIKLNSFMQMDRAVKKVLSIAQADVIVIERAAWAAGGNSHEVLGQMKGVLLLNLAQAGYSDDKVSEVSFKTWVKGLTGSGNNNKKMVKQLVECYLDVKFKGTDETDAIGIGLWWAKRRLR